MLSRPASLLSAVYRSGIQTPDNRLQQLAEPTCGSAQAPADIATVVRLRELDPLNRPIGGA